MEPTSELKKAKQMVELKLMQQRLNELENKSIPPDTDQKKIKQQNELSLRILNSIPFQVYLIDASDMTIKLTNLEGFNYISSTQDSHCYSYIHGLNKPCGNTGYPCVLERVKEAKRFVIVENTIVDEDGKLRYIEIQGYPIFDINGNVVYMVEAIIDISLRKVAQKDLLESEHKYRKLFEEANDAIFLRDMHTGNIIDANKQAERLLGRSVKEIIGMHYTKLYAPGMTDRYKKKFDSLLKVSHIENFEAEIYRKDKSVVAVNISASVITFQDKKLIQEIIRDVTEYKQTEKALMENEEFKSSLLNRSPNPLFVISPDASIMYVNPALEKLTGFTADELIGKKFPYPWWRKKHTRSITSLLSRGGEIELVGDEIQFRNKKDEKFWVERNSIPVKVEDELKYILISWNNITERKYSELQLLDYQKELRSLASQLSLAEERERRRIAVYVHDHISQNIAVCSMKLSALLEELPSTRTKEAISEVDTLLKHLITETRALTFELSSPLLYELGLEAAIEQLTEQLQEQHGIQFSFKNDKRRKPLDDDIRVLVFQAVRELLINAVKHSQASFIEVSLKRVNNKLRTYVEDNGTGFDTSQFTDNRKRFKGFGLFSIRERLNFVGGDIEIKPMTETGTQIILTVPLKLL